MAMEQFRSKLPGSVMVALQEKLAAGASWTLTLLMERLGNYLNVREIAYGTSRAETTAKPSASSNPAQARPRSGNFATNFLSSQTPAPNSTSGGKPYSACVFCNSEHFHEQCDQYKTLEECKARLLGLACCFICLRQGHH